MRIVYNISGTCNSGGKERILSNKVNYFCENTDNEVYILTTDQDNRPPFYHFSGKAHFHDLSVNYFRHNDYSLPAKIISHFIKKTIHRKRLKKLLYRIKADICVSMFGEEMSFLYKINDGSRKILEIHSSKDFRTQYAKSHKRGYAYYLVSLIRSRLEFIHIKSYDRFVVLTNQDKGLWGDLANCIVIPNSLSFYPEEKASLSNKTVIAVGRLSYEKGYDRLMKIWSEIHKTHPDWTLEIYGNGDLYEQLDANITREGMGDVIRILPPTGSIIEKYLNSSIYVLTSYHEGLPLALMEAMACGLPSLAYYCQCGPSDIITDKVDGFLIKEDDDHDFVKNLSFLMDNIELRRNMGVKAKENIKRFSPDVIMRLWSDLFKKLKSNNVEQ